MGKIKDKIRNLSVRKTILLYLVFSLMISFLVSTYVVWASSRIQEEIWWKYADEDSYFEAVDMENQVYMSKIPRHWSSKMSPVYHSVS